MNRRERSSSERSASRLRSPSAWARWWAPGSSSFRASPQAARGAGKLQSYIVLALVAILSVLFLYGVLDAFGIIGERSLPGAFAPEGTWPIFTTTALIFTSYLGFEQVAAVGGEIREPHRNLPRALIGSVILVTVRYVLALFVASSTLTRERLAEQGETAMIEVARSLVGWFGAVAVLFAGLLATLSSANASVLSSSRAGYALARDELVPEWMSRVNERFGTPHVALIAVASRSRGSRSSAG